MHVNPGSNSWIAFVLRDSIKLGLFLKKYPDIKINNVLSLVCLSNKKPLFINLIKHYTNFMVKAIYK